MQKIDDKIENKSAIKPCPKNKKNAPCCGIFEGKCEVFNENYCVFYVAFLKNKGLK
jgi:hypothetical protein